MKYRKKPVVVDAVQWFKDGDHPAVYQGGLSGCYYIDTLEGEMRVRPGDYIITGVKGEHYPCKPDIFEMTYEPEALAELPAQPSKPWVGLTDEEVQAAVHDENGCVVDYEDYASAIEAKLKEKNT